MSFFDNKYFSKKRNDFLANPIEDEVEKEEFLAERRRLQYFVRASGNKRIDGTLELLSFIERYHLGDYFPNILILLRIFLTWAISVASC